MREKEGKEMSSRFRIIHITLSINSQGLGSTLYLTTLGIKATSYFDKMIVFTHE